MTKYIPKQSGINERNNLIFDFCLFLYLNDTHGCVLIFRLFSEEESTKCIYARYLKESDAE